MLESDQGKTDQDTCWWKDCWEYFLCFYQRIIYYCRHPADHRCDPGLVFGVYFYQREEVTSVSGSVVPQQ